MSDADDLASPARAELAKSHPPAQQSRRFLRLGLLSLGLGLVVGFALAWRLPPSHWGFIPRPVPAISSQEGCLFSPDGRFLATRSSTMDSLHTDRGYLHLWDLATAREMFRIPHDRIFPPGVDPGYSDAFSADGQHFIVAGFGRADVWEMESGKKIGTAHEMKTGLFDRTCLLATDAEGRPFWLMTEPGRYRFHDLHTGREMGSIPGPAQQGPRPDIFPGYLLVESKKGCQLWEVPEGKLRLELPPMRSERDSYWALSGDGSTLAFVDGKVRIQDTRGGKMWTLGMPGDQFPSLSHDGRQLAVLVHGRGEGDDWLSQLWGQLEDSSGDDASGVIVYDLESVKHVANFPGAHSAIFAPDGRTLAVRSGEEIVLYDPAEVRPWGKIIGGAAVSGLACFLTGFLVAALAQRSRCRAK